ncbi:MAG: LysR family transcriptional regulator [Rhodospirillales bacterium]|jgi:DNA-binding transcriptional LysR family regulator|nr:LysR family transcriptional regulator [Rhodospirillales bacterium]
MELRKLDLNLLLILDALLDDGNLTRAAHCLQLSQPAVSSGLGRLRMILGDELFIRSHGVMVPTERAHHLREPVKRVLEIVRQEVLGQAGFDARTDAGTFTVSTSDIGELEFLPGLIERLADKAPGASVRTIICDPRTLADAMDRGDIDLAVGFFPDLQTSVFKQQVLFAHGSVCIVREGHPVLADGISLEQYREADHIAVSQASRLHDVVELALAEQRLQRRTVATVSHFVNVPFLVSRSDLVGTIPRPLALQQARTFPLKVFDVPFPVPSLEIKQVWHRRFDNSPRLMWFRSVIAEMSQNKPSM